MNNSELISALAEWGEIAYKSKSFEKRFCPNAWILTSVSWDSENMKVVYILACGQHVCDSFKIEQWLDFLKKEG
jgi:hypothetical protein